MGFTEKEKIKLMSDVAVIKSRLEGLPCEKHSRCISELYDRDHENDAKIERTKYSVFLAILSFLMSLGVVIAAIVPAIARG